MMITVSAASAIAATLVECYKGYSHILAITLITLNTFTVEQRDQCVDK